MSHIVLEPTFLPLNERGGWRTCTAEGVRVSVVLRLAARQDGPLGLGWRDGSLGGLTLPRGFAMDDQGNPYLLAPREPWEVKRFDPERKAFVALPGIGGSGRAVRQFRQPRNIAIAGRNLYVADVRNRRVQVFDLPTLALVYVWEHAPRITPRTSSLPAGRRWRGEEALWCPLDVTTYGMAAYILDSRNQRVYRHRVGTDDLELYIEGANEDERWRRVVTDRMGQVYVLDVQKRSKPRLLIYNTQGQREEETDDAGSVRDRFDVPVVQMFFDRCHPERSYFYWPQPLRRQQPKSPTGGAAGEACDPPLPQAGQQQRRLIFDRAGDPACPDTAELVEYPLYQAEGTWISEALDSTIFRCQWHRVELEVDELPPGTQMEVWSYSSDELQPLPRGSALWEERPSYVAAGQLQPPPADREGLPALAPKPPAPPPDDFLVQSREGQFLWLKVTLRSDGFGTPTLRGLRVHFPRDSYLQYLPSVYAADDASRWFLERFLSIFQTEWDTLERRIQNATAYFDPDAVPGPFLDQLLQRFGLPVEGKWRVKQRRTLLRGMRDFYTQRGTVAGLRAYLQAYLQNLSGLTPAQQRAYPVLVEGWRERQRLELATPKEEVGTSALGLWSPSEVGRLQIGSFARVGEVRLVDSGDPQSDFFNEFAHRFRVYVPAAWVRTAADERMLRRALEAEKPAPSAYDLCLVEGRFRVGIQSTIGFDTILGAYPQARLTCRKDDEALPPSRAPRHRLGYDTVLAAGASPAPVLPLGDEGIRM